MGMIAEGQRRPLFRAGVRTALKNLLTRAPAPETAPVRAAISSQFDRALPFCPPSEGELLRSIILVDGVTRALEVGFATGSTALYMLQALANSDGELVSIDRPEGPYNEVGKALVASAATEMKLGRHRLMEMDSARAIPELFSEGQTFEVIFVDGWKTFDHLAAEVYYLTRMLRVDGVIVFDDAAMPSVNKVIRLLQTHYAYAEVDYRRYGDSPKVRLFQILTSRSVRRPYRGFRKTRAETELPVTQDWNYFRRF